jgi:hypothetical protein
MSAVTARVHVAPGFEDGRREKKSHWVHEEPTLFRNPWPSYQDKVRYSDLVISRDMLISSVTQTRGELFKMLLGQAMAKQNTVAEAENIPIVKPDFGAKRPADEIKATWLGSVDMLIRIRTVRHKLKVPTRHA